LGCQLTALLEWVPYVEGIVEDKQPRFIENTSARFESRFSSVQIQGSPATTFRSMEGSSLGVWVAHGEGRVHFPTPESCDCVVEKSLGWRLGEDGGGGAR
jgi:phosphoribosylformylglycinamidine synthase